MEPDNDDPLDDRGQRPAARPEYEVAYYTKELGRSLQRKMLQSQLTELKNKPAHGGAEGREPQADSHERSGSRDKQGGRAG
jgi:hypothetical protein